MTEDAPADVLRALLRHDLRAAMKAQHRHEMTALRMLISAVDNAESVEGSPAAPRPSSEHVAGAVPGVGAAEARRRPLSEPDLQRIIETELSDRHEQADRLDSLGRADEATRLRAEADVIARYRSAGT